MIPQYIVTKKVNGITYYWNGTHQPSRWFVQWEGLINNAKPMDFEDRDYLIGRLQDEETGTAEYGYISAKSKKPLHG